MITFIGLRPCSAKTQQRVIDVATVVLDIAKESADVFAPLKSCLGGIDAFRKHYGVRPHRSDHDLPDASILGMQRCRRKGQGPYPMARKLGEHCGDSRL